ncbi:MAG: hypothetical protein GEV10_04255 [Streptosporangiales bacterium]|nr:hypothetical protein [Streptosporangiales bacterium]
MAELPGVVRRASVDAAALTLVATALVAALPGHARAEQVCGASTSSWVDQGPPLLTTSGTFTGVGGTGPHGGPAVARLELEKDPLLGDRDATLTLRERHPAGTSVRLTGSWRLTDGYVPHLRLRGSNPQSWSVDFGAQRCDDDGEVVAVVGGEIGIGTWFQWQNFTQWERQRG